MLRKIRVIAAAVCFVLITLLFLDFTGTVHQWFGWLAKIQFWPAFLALNVGVVIGLILLTLLLGRVYCSVICPLGVMQNIIDKEVFQFDTGFPIDGIKRAYIRETVITELAEA